METTHALTEYNLTTDEERLTQMMKALGHPARMQIVRYLSENPGCITGDIVDALPLAQATVSQHLKVLREAGFAGRSKGQQPATAWIATTSPGLKSRWVRRFKATLGLFFLPCFIVKIR